jgi:hypothetical protein
MKSIDKQEILKAAENIDRVYNRMVKIVDFLLATMFDITIVCLFIAAIAWFFGIVAPWPILAVLIILLLLFGLLNNKTV